MSKFIPKKLQIILKILFILLGLGLAAFTLVTGVQDSITSDKAKQCFLESINYNEEALRIINSSEYPWYWQIFAEGVIEREKSSKRKRGFSPTEKFLHENCYDFIVLAEVTENNRAIGSTVFVDTGTGLRPVRWRNRLDDKHKKSVAVFVNTRTYYHPEMDILLTFVVIFALAPIILLSLGKFVGAWFKWIFK